MRWWLDIGAMIAAYGLGCLVTGYYWVRWRTGEDIRDSGSGGAGARNVGRRLGWGGFAITFLGDFGKGALAVCGAEYAGVDPWGMVGVIWAVVGGHIWPMPLRFRGGKGVATSLGALLIYDPVAVLLLTVGTGLGYVLLRNLVVSGLLAFALLPLAPWVRGSEAATTWAYLGLALVLWLTHRQNLRRELSGLRTIIRLKNNRLTAHKTDEAHTAIDV